MRTLLHVLWRGIARMESLLYGIRGFRFRSLLERYGLCILTLRIGWQTGVARRRRVSDNPSVYGLLYRVLL